MKPQVVLRLAIVASLTVGLFGQTPLPRALQKSKLGQRIEVTMKGGEKVRGRLVTLGTDRFTIAPEPRGTAQREIPLAEVSKVRKKLTTQDKWIIAGLVYGGLVLMGYVLEH